MTLITAKYHRSVQIGQYPQGHYSCFLAHVEQLIIYFEVVFLFMCAMAILSIMLTSHYELIIKL